MRASLEMRWFYGGALPKSIGQWFGSDSLGGYLSPPEEREDIYLLVPSCDYLGVKLRGKTLEVKWQQGELGAMQFGNRWEGKAQKWLKWVVPTRWRRYRRILWRQESGWESRKSERSVFTKFQPLVP